MEDDDDDEDDGKIEVRRVGKMRILMKGQLLVPLLLLMMLLRVRWKDPLLLAAAAVWAKFYYY